MLSNFFTFLNKDRVKIILIYDIIITITAVLTYRVIYILMNCGPFFDEVIILHHAPPIWKQFVFVMGFAIISGSTYLWFMLSWISKVEPDNVLKNNYSLKLRKIRINCINLPFFIFSFQTIVVSGITFLYSVFHMISTASSFSMLVKINIIIFVFFSQVSTLSFIFSKNIFSRILYKTYTKEGLEGKRRTLNKKIMLQILPMFISAIFLTSLLGYSRVIDEKSNVLFKLYKYKLDEAFKGYNANINESQIEMELESLTLETSKDIWFIIHPKGKVSTSNKTELNSFLLMYLNNFSKLTDGHIYSDEGETQGVMIEVPTNEGLYMVGIEYEVSSNSTMIYFLAFFLILLVIHAMVVYFFTKSLSGDITTVAKGLTEIVQGHSENLEKRIPVTSNDEIADLVIAFNKLQELHRENENTIKEKNQNLNSMNSELTAMNQELIALNEQLKDYSDTVEELTLVKERNRFARDVHDTLGHTMTLLISLIEVCKESVDSDTTLTKIKLDQLLDLSKAGLSDLRRSIKGIVPNKLEFNNLLTSLNELFEDFRVTGVKIDFSVAGTCDLSDKEMINTIFRLCQEALTNSLRHGKAKNISIILNLSIKVIKLSIFDDGVGCTSIKKGTGLLGMEQRITALGGYVIFGSFGDEGFNINAVIPLENKK